MLKKNLTRLVISFISHPLFTMSGSMKLDDDKLTKIGFVNVVETKIGCVNATVLSEESSLHPLLLDKMTMQPPKRNKSLMIAV